MPLNRICRLTAAACVAVTLTACTTAPIKRWEPPARADVPETTTDYAITYANRARSAYQAAIDEQTAYSSGISSGLIGLGGVMAALAAFNAHRDAIVGLGLAGATTYAVANWNYSKQRQLIYMAGIEGISCAVRAITPLYISEAKLTVLKRKLVDLETASRQAVGASTALASAGGGLPTDDPARKDMDAALAEANARLEAARGVSKSGHQFVSVAMRAGAELIGAVNRIDDTVGKALLDTLPDLAAVPKVVGSLSGLAASFAPSPEMGQTIVDAITASGRAQAQAKEEAGRKSSKRTGAFDAALLALKARSSELAEATAVAQAHLAGYDTAASSERLKDCGVTAVDTALRAKETRREIAPKKDATYRVGVSGGVKPYMASFSKAPAEGLTIRNPVTYDEYIELVATKSLAAADNYVLDVRDSSSPKKEVSVTLAVGAATAGKAAGAATPSASVKEALVERAKALEPWDAKGVEFRVDQERTRLTELGDVVIGVSCEPQPAAPMKESEVRAAFFDRHGKDPAVDAARLDSVQPAFRSGDAKCIAGETSAQSREVRSGRSASGRRIAPDRLEAAQLAVIQKNLCMSNGDIDGIWGPKSAAALGRWRSAQADAVRASTGALTPREYAQLYTADPRDRAARCKR